MKGTLATLFFLTVGAVALSDTTLEKELVESNKLRRVLTRSKLIEGGNLLQSWAYATPERNRGFGGIGMFLGISHLCIIDKWLIVSSS